MLLVDIALNCSVRQEDSCVFFSEMAVLRG